MVDSGQWVETNCPLFTVHCPLSTEMSIRLRLSLWYVLVLAGILITFAGLLYAVLSFSLFSEVDRRLQIRAADVENSLATALELQTDPRIFISRGGRLTLPTADTFATPGVFVQIATLEGVALTRSENLGAQTLVVSPAALTQVTRGETVYANLTKDRVPLRVYIAPLTVRGQVLAAIVVAESLQGANDTLRRLAFLLIAGIAAGLLFAFGIGAVLAYHALAPIDRITQTAHTIARANDLTRRIEAKATRDEVGRLAATFNAMLGRIEELFRAQQRFVADVSHELRSPLTAIRGNLDLLRRGALDDPEARQETLAAIEAESARMQRLVQDLLLLAQADAGVPIEKRVVELDTLLLDVFRQARLNAGNVKVSLGSEDQVQVIGDADRLKQLFLNLMDNAIKYTPSGGAVTLSFARENDWVRVAVADTGVGIPAQDLPKIFDRFYRVDKARSREKGGTGLGLAICKWIVDAHNGRIEAQSEVGKGSVFTVWLPVSRQ
ncbi:MAG: HAMP domain-containing protein [Chloroflexi bacterium]|nr:HAMP domain-containing protein [Chloroflexota bacterium]